MSPTSMVLDKQDMTPYYRRIVLENPPSSQVDHLASEKDQLLFFARRTQILQESHQKL